MVGTVRTHSGSFAVTSSSRSLFLADRKGHLAELACMKLRLSSQTDVRCKAYTLR
jgi:hypothetical protein